MKLKTFIKSSTSFMLISFILSGCASSYQNKVEQNTLNGLKQVDINDLNIKEFYNKLKVSYIYDDSKEYAFTTAKGFDLAKNYCKANNGVFGKDIYDGVYGFHAPTSIAPENIKHRHLNVSRIVLKNDKYICEKENKLLFYIAQIKSTKNKNDAIYIDTILDISENTAFEHKTRVKLKKGKEKAVELKKQSKKKRWLTAQADKKKVLVQKRKEQSLLRKRRGTYEVVFYTEIKYVGNAWHKEVCIEKCKELSLNNSGYENLQSALNDNWKHMSYTGKTEHNVDISCSCIGSKNIIKK